MAVQTVLGATGTSRFPWASFSGKVEAAPEKDLGPYTQLRALAVPWSRYGSFTGKAEAEPEAGGNLLIINRRRRGRR